ncbi:MAG: hypothetical protein H8E14_15675 [Candidatus Marinimicrobia bacterium]|nr:hypothetical protein [Candidatus Neomarinimicrobiota bacterium]
MSIINFNKVIIIQSLSAGNYKSGNILYEDSLKWKELTLHNLKVEFICIDNKVELKKIFKKIKDEAILYNLYPLLHFDMHGSREKDGLILSNGDFISWWDLKDDLTDINISTANNLFITLATCYGGFLYKILGTYDRAPFWGLIAPLDIIESYYVSVNFNVFYNELLTSFDYKKAIEKLNNSNEKKTPFAFINSERVFLNAWKHYSINLCSPAALENRGIKIAKKANAKYGVSKQVIKRFCKEYLVKNKENHFYQFRDLFFMIDLFPENLARFNLKYEEIEKLMLLK